MNDLQQLLKSALPYLKQIQGGEEGEDEFLDYLIEDIEEGLKVNYEDKTKP